MTGPSGQHRIMPVSISVRASIRTTHFSFFCQQSMRCRMTRTRRPSMRKANANKSILYILHHIFDRAFLLFDLFFLDVLKSCPQCACADVPSASSDCPLSVVYVFGGEAEKFYHRQKYSNASSPRSWIKLQKDRGWWKRFQNPMKSVGATSNF